MAQKNLHRYQARRQSICEGLCPKGYRVVARSSLTASFMFSAVDKKVEDRKSNTRKENGKQN
jgi:hypothetical protein